LESQLEVKCNEKCEKISAILEKSQDPEEKKKAKGEAAQWCVEECLDCTEQKNCNLWLAFSGIATDIFLDQAERRKLLGKSVRSSVFSKGIKEAVPCCGKCHTGIEIANILIESDYLEDAVIVLREIEFCEPNGECCADSSNVQETIAQLEKLLRNKEWLSKKWHSRFGPIKDKLQEHDVEIVKISRGGIEGYLAGEFTIRRPTLFSCSLKRRLPTSEVTELAEVAIPIRKILAMLPDKTQVNVVSGEKVRVYGKNSFDDIIIEAEPLASLERRRNADAIYAKVKASD